MSELYLFLKVCVALGASWVLILAALQLWMERSGR